MLLVKKLVVAIVLLLPVVGYANSDLISVGRDFLYSPVTGDLFLVEDKRGRAITRVSDNILVNFQLDRKIPREGFKDVDLFTDTKKQRYVGLRVLNKEFLFSKTLEAIGKLDLKF